MVVKRCLCGCGRFVKQASNFLRGHSCRGLWWFEGKPHTTLGKKRPDAAKRMLNEGNPEWKGDDVGPEALHDWVKRHKPKPLVCEMCNEKPPYDLANICNTYNPLTYNRNIANWRWWCRRCHMSSDGRSSALTRNYGAF